MVQTADAIERDQPVWPEYANRLNRGTLARRRRYCHSNSPPDLT